MSAFRADPHRRLAATCLNRPTGTRGGYQFTAVAMLLAALTVILAACKSPPVAADGVESESRMGGELRQPGSASSARHATPENLTVDVSVLVGRTPNLAQTVDRRQGRFILFPDGSLHADVGPTLRPDVRPGLTRRLRDGEVTDVWRVIVESDLDDPASFAPPTNAALLAAPRGTVAHVVTIDADGRRWQIIRLAPVDGEEDPVTTALVRRLAALAWESDLSSEALLPGGIRYDFGPDPHATFRHVGVDPPPLRGSPGGAR